MGCSNSKAETAQVANPADKSEPRRNRNRRRRSADDHDTSSSHNDQQPMVLRAPMVQGHHHNKNNHPPPQPPSNIGTAENPLQGQRPDDEVEESSAHSFSPFPLPTLRGGGEWTILSDGFSSAGSGAPRWFRSHADREEGPVGEDGVEGVPRSCEHLAEEVESASPMESTNQTKSTIMWDESRSSFASTCSSERPE